MVAPRALVSALLCLLVYVSVACERREQHAAPREAQRARRVASTRDAGAPRREPDAAQEARAREPPVRMQVRALEGAVQADCPIALGGYVESPCTVRFVRGDQLTLSLDDHVRVVLRGPGLVQLLPSGLPALLLREGQLTLDVAPRGPRASQSAFWLATPTLRLDVADSVRAALHADAQISALAVVSGYLTVSRPEGALAVPAGSTLCVGPRAAKVLPLRVATLELSAAKLAQQTPCERPPKPDAAAPDLLEAAFDTALAGVALAHKLEQDMLAEHTRLVAAGDTRALPLRAELAHVAAELLRGRERARALRAQLEARSLARTPTATVASLLTRASSLGIAD